MTKPSRPASNGRDARLRIVVARRERAHRGEAADDRLVDAGLGAAGEHDVGVAAPDDLRRLADGVAAGRAGRDGREVRPGHPEADRDLAGADVGDAHRDEERADPVRAAQGVDRDAVDERPDAAEAGAEDRPRSARRARPRGAPAGRPGPAPRARRRARTGCSGRSGAGPCGRGRALGSKSWTSPAIRDGQPRRVERLDRPDAGPPGDEALPGGRDVVAEGRDGAHAGDDDAARAPRRLIGRACPVRTVAAR